MAVPKRKQSKRRTALRRSQNMKVKILSSSVCPQCKQPTLPHRVCSHCGFYKGREIVKKIKVE